MGERFRPEDRIRHKSRFQKIYGRKQVLYSRTFVVYHAPAEGGRSRIGLTVSRKIGGAVVRNRARRLIREVFRRERCGLAQPLDLVINTKRSIREAGFLDLKEEFRTVIRRLNRCYRPSGRETTGRRREPRRNGGRSAPPGA